jgi:hypothetical protein
MPGDSELGAFVARCVETLEAEGAGALQRLLEAHPHLAGAARARLQRLDRAQLLAPYGPARSLRPERIGRYEVVAVLGRGGMGEVFLARQHGPLPREVAVKVVRAALASDEVLARFAIEREAMGRMRHPHIATLYDAGSTELGRPYFVMEHVPGPPLTRYCDEHRLDARGRLELFLQVCDAVQHAHDKGVLHRDLKPSNVLVAHNEGRPVAKVIDFGVAKAVGGPLRGEGTPTRHGDLLGTPEYMSPEQAAGGELEVDTRTDVYALGVILYELLTGVVPFDGRRLRAAGQAGMIEILRHETPARPSTRLTPGTPATRRAARLRRTHPTLLRRSLRRDHDWIVLQALEKDRDRRYASVSDLALDVRRVLAHEPVTARPPSVAYRLARALRRHRVLLATAGLAAAALVAAVSIVLVAAAQARRAAAAAVQARQQATAALDRADGHFAQANAAVEAMLAAVDPAIAATPAVARVRGALLARALQLQERLRQGDGTTARGARRLARAQAAIGRIRQAQGEAGAAQEALVAAHRAFTTVLQLAPRDVETRRARARNAYVLAATLRQLGDVDGARALYREGLADHAASPPAPAAAAADGARMAEALRDLAALQAHDPGAAADTLRLAAATAAAVTAMCPAELAAPRCWVAARVDLANLHLRQGERGAAAAELAAARVACDALAIRTRGAAGFPTLAAEVLRQQASLRGDGPAPEAAAR